jgi:hypothetical protein
MSIYPLVNITYHRQNIICNYVGELIVAVVFVVIVFQLYVIYRQASFVSNLISNSEIFSNYFPTL